MRRESQESKALAQKKIDLMDAERAKEQEEADALREEARATFAQAMIEEHAAVASQQLTEDAAAGHGPVDTTDETVDKPADEELSHVERITQILKERSELTASRCCNDRLAATACSLPAARRRSLRRRHHSYVHDFHAACCSRAEPCCICSTHR